MIRSQKRLFDPRSQSKFEISRSKIDLFLECPRCFYLDRRLGISRPSIPAFTLNSAVDHLLKKEFDIHRANKSAHPIMESHGVDAVPFKHASLDHWRNNFHGVRYLYPIANFEVFGAIDDVWQSKNGDLHVVDYKATSKGEAPTLEGRWQESYKRQMEVYQWLMRNNGFSVSPTGYFVYVNGRRDRAMFDAKLEFDTYLLTYEGDTSWIEPTLRNIHEVLRSDAVPKSGTLCEYCPYRDAAGHALLKE